MAKQMRTEQRRAIKAAIPSADAANEPDGSSPVTSPRKKVAQDAVCIACQKIGATIAEGRAASSELQQLCADYPQLEFVAAHQVFAKHLGRKRNVAEAMTATKAELAQRAPEMIRHGS